MKVSSKPKKALASYSGAGPADWKNWGPNRRRQWAKSVYDQNSKDTRFGSTSWDDLTKDQQDWIIANDEAPRGGIQHASFPKDYPDWWYSDDKTDPDKPGDDEKDENEEDEPDEPDKPDKPDEPDKPDPEDTGYEPEDWNYKPDDRLPQAPVRGQDRPKRRKPGELLGDKKLKKKDYRKYSGLYSEPKRGSVIEDLALDKKDYKDYTPDDAYAEEKGKKAKASKPKASKPKASKPATASTPKQRYTSRGGGNYIRS